MGGSFALRRDYDAARERKYLRRDGLASLAVRFHPFNTSAELTTCLGRKGIPMSAPQQAYVGNL